MTDRYDRLKKQIRLISSGAKHGVLDAVDVAAQVLARATAQYYAWRKPTTRCGYVYCQVVVLWGFFPAFFPKHVFCTALPGRSAQFKAWPVNTKGTVHTDIQAQLPTSRRRRRPRSLLSVAAAFRLHDPQRCVFSVMCGSWLRS
jgi:hypothetical protein